MNSSNPIDINEIETPQVLVDQDRLMENIRWMQENADNHRVDLRPHVKTHKCLRIGQLQLEQGAIGITTSKVDEAIVFIEGGFESVTVAHPILDVKKLIRLFKVAKAHDVALATIVDSITGINAMAPASRDAGFDVDVFVKIDVGLHRCGLKADDNRLLVLVDKLESSKGLRFKGLLAHAGHAYGVESANEVKIIAKQERDTMVGAAHRIEKAGYQVPVMSVGSTPTCRLSETYDGITEIRPGNYVFLDRTQVALDTAKLQEVSLSVLATVVSTNHDHYIIDAGSKAFSSDLGPHGTDSVRDHGTAYTVEDYGSKAGGGRVVKLSEEHGFIPKKDCNLVLGSIVRIIPNHSCAVANLSKDLAIVRDDDVIDRWDVDARGCVR